MKINIAAVQFAMTEDPKNNLAKALALGEDAARWGAQIIVLPELFEHMYFCKTQNEAYFSLAAPMEENPGLRAFQSLAQQLKITVAVPFFEKCGPCFYNSVAVVDADGSILGLYRKTHIPDGAGYQEKYYFRPGDTGLKVFKTAHGPLGLGICWDQWFPEAARALTLRGAEIIAYPTAIGSEPNHPELLTKDLWQRVMQGQAVANMIPIVAANRIGKEDGQIFYGHSFICDEFGEKLYELKNDEEGIIVAQIDCERAQKNRASFGFFRDRRPDLY